MRTDGYCLLTMSGRCFMAIRPRNWQAYRWTFFHTNGKPTPPVHLAADYANDIKLSEEKRRVYVSKLDQCHTSESRCRKDRQISDNRTRKSPTTRVNQNLVTNRSFLLDTIDGIVGRPIRYIFRVFIREPAVRKAIGFSDRKMVG